MALTLADQVAVQQQEEQIYMVIGALLHNTNKKNK